MSVLSGVGAVRTEAACTHGQRDVLTVKVLWHCGVTCGLRGCWNVWILLGYIS